MKKSLFVVGFCIVLCHSISFAAEYKIQKGDAISTIAKKTGSSIEQIAKLNSIKGPMYVVRAGSIIRYVSENDLVNAQKWTEQHLEGLYPDHPDYATFIKILEDIKTRNIKYVGNLSTHADEVILFANLHRKQLERQ
ncbi:MAG TPA: LysM peptidoglycan-binding domain-containing protein [Candidatus Pacebacteria bacterium]|nr:LysM peptidoglycan-binding domain-containing protein [Candidatus Paceibacterota bacterium]